MKSDKSSNYTLFCIGFKERVIDFVIKKNERRKEKFHNPDNEPENIADDFHYEHDDEPNRFDDQHVQESSEKPEWPVKNRSV